LKLEKQTEDARGRIFWFSDNNGREIHLVEVKKGFARGGHYHPFDSMHIVISGKVLYREFDIRTSAETVRQVGPATTINTPAFVAHMIIAEEEDSLFVEIFEKEYEATDYAPYRSIVEERMRAS
jgi:dTDP-4-dehydrorhamnose 3,5-epimerase-like enzyme